MEIGKHDLVNNTSLYLLFMKKGKSYHGIMLDQIFARNPELKTKLSEKFSENLKLGYIKPLPRIVFRMDQIETAFRYMTTDNHTGKVMISIRKEEKNVTNGKTVFTYIPKISLLF